MATEWKKMKKIHVVSNSLTNRIKQSWIFSEYGLASAWMKWFGVRGRCWDELVDVSFRERLLLLRLLQALASVTSWLLRTTRSACLHDCTSLFHTQCSYNIWVCNSRTIRKEISNKLRCLDVVQIGSTIFWFDNSWQHAVRKYDGHSSVARQIDRDRGLGY